MFKESIINYSERLLRCKLFLLKGNNIKDAESIYGKPVVMIALNELEVERRIENDKGK